MNTLHPILRQALAKIVYPGFSLDIVSMGLVEEASLRENGLAEIRLRPLSAPPENRPVVEKSIKTALLALPQVTRVEIASQAANAAPIAGVEKILAVASCKGGVGKSTLAVNLANALAGTGLRVGLLDLDIYGPSLPTMLGLEGRGVEADNEGCFLPLTTAQGVKALSLGFMIAKGQALSWRGPMLGKVMRQLCFSALWRPLDILLLDLPPGSGDVQMSLLRHIILDGVVLVSTAEAAAISDTRRGISLFKQAGIVGLVENMSYFICPCCGEKQRLFGGPVLEELASENGLDFLGSIPLNPAVRQLAANYCASDPAAAPYARLAQKIVNYLKG